MDTHMQTHKPVAVRSALNYDADALAVATSIKSFDPSRTRQSDMLSADINYIVKNYGLTGTLPVSVRLPTYEDYSESIDDYQTALNAVLAAQESFLQVPANIRERFNHDPQAFLEFCSDEKNLPELRSLGLAIPAQEAAGAHGDTPPATPPKG